MNALLYNPVEDSLQNLQSGSGTNFPYAVDITTLEDPFDRARALVNRLVVQPTIGAVSGISGIGAARQGRNALAAMQDTQKWLEPLSKLSEPRTEGGKKLARYVDYPFEKLAEGGGYVGDKVYDWTKSPELAAGASTAVQAMPLALGLRGKGRVAPGEVRVANEFSPKALEYRPELYEGMGQALYEMVVPPAIGKQQSISRTAVMLNEPRFTEKQPVMEWVKTLKAKGIPKDEPAVLKVLSELGGMPIKQRMTKAEVQQMLNSHAPELETVIAKNHTHGNLPELFVRDPNEYRVPTKEQLNRKTDLTIEKSKLQDRYYSAINELEKMYGEFYRANPNSKLDLTPDHPEYPRLQNLIKQRDIAEHDLGIIDIELGAFTGPRFDGHSWAKQKELSSPIGRTRMDTRNNADGTKTLIIDNFQKPTEGSGQRDLMPKEHETRAYDLMAQSVLNYARENGFRDIEWTTGTEQNARWGVEVPPEAFADLANPKKGRMVEGDLRPVYNKTLPQLMEKHGQGQKVGQGAQIDLANYAGADFDVDPGKMEGAIAEAIEDGAPIISRQAEKFNNEFLESGNIFGDLLIDKPELKDWLTRYFYGKTSEYRQAINIQGQKPQALVYEGMGQALYNSLKGGAPDATQDREK